MVRVLTILSGLDGGGVENILLNYYQNMDRKKVHIDFIVHSQHIGKLEGKFEELGSKIYRVTPKTVSLKKNIIEIYEIMKNNRYDIVHSRMNVKGTTHLVTAWFCGIKVRMIHNHMAYVPMHGKMKYLTPPAKLICKLFATHWLACSDAAAIDMFGEKAYKQGKVIVLNNAIDAEKYDYNPIERKSVRDEFNLKDEFVIGVVGRFHEQKNHKFMLKILKEIVNENKNIKLLLVGGGELEKEVHQWVNEYNLNNYVIFTGIRTDVPRLLQGMDVFLLPTLYEGFGNVFVEAQAAGLKTFASLEGVPKSTKLTDLIEYISLDESPKIWADKILEYQNGYKRESQIEKIRAAGFDVKKQAIFLENLYIEACAQENLNKKTSI